MMIFSVIILLLLFPTQALASIFDPSHADKSVEYLGMIFGGSLGGINLGFATEANSFLGNLFQAFNGIILAVAIFILSYVGILSVVNTAQEGQVMGKKWSSVWIPLRSSVGLLLLAPIPGSGYSFLQVTLMWIVLNGIGAADKMWNLVLNHMTNGISVTQGVQIDDPKAETNRNQLISNGTDLGKILLNNLVCLEIIKENTKNQPIHNNLKPRFKNKNTSDNGNISENIIFGGNNYNGYGNNLCGQITVNTALTPSDLDLGFDADELDKQLNSHQKHQIVSIAHNTKINAIKEMIRYITPVATAIAQANTDATGLVFPKAYHRTGLLYKAAITYQQAMSVLNKGSVMAQIGVALKNHTGLLTPDEIITQGHDYGWITAGSFYYLFNQKMKQDLLSTAIAEIQSSPESDPFLNENKFKDNIANFSIPNVKYTIFSSYIRYRDSHNLVIEDLFKKPEWLHDNLQIPDAFKTASDKHTSKAHTALHNEATREEEYKDTPFVVPTDHAGMETSIDKLKIEQKAKDKLKAVYNDFYTSFKKLLFMKQLDDPLIAIAHFGMKLMQGAETCWGLIIGGALVPEKINTLLEPTKTPDMKLAIELAVGLIPAMSAFVGIMWTAGATLAIYTPLIPYLMFMVTALSWLLLVVESIVAAPIIALGLIAPAQDELGKIVPALGIIASIFLKPILMIIGLILGAKVYQATLSMVNLGFEFSFKALQAQTGASLFSWVVMVILYTAFILTLVNKCYALIYQLPDKILRWIGVTGEPTDVSSIKETQQSVEQQSKQAISPVEGAATSASNKIKTNLEAFKSNADAAKKPEDSQT